MSGKDPDTAAIAFPSAEDARDRTIALALDGSTVGVWEWLIRDGTITRRHNWGHTFGYAGDAGGTAWADALHPEERQSILQRGRDFLRGRIDSFELEHRLRDASGEWRWVVTRGRLVERDASGRPSRAVGVYLDVTDQKRAQTLTRESEERYRALIESAGDAIAVIDEDGVFRFLNSHAAERLGGAPEDYVGRTMDSLFPPEIAASQLANIRQVIRSRQGMVRDSLTVLQGESRMYHTSLQPLPQSAGGRPAALMVARDITERRIAEQEMAKLNAQLTRRAAQLRLLAAELTRAEHRERRRVAGVLHDRVQQTLAAAKLRLGMLQDVTTGVESRALAAQIAEMLAAAISDVRTLAVEISPPILRESSLKAALAWLADQFWKQHGLRVRVESDPLCDAPSEDTLVFLFEAARELLFNVRKHACVDAAVVKTGTGEGSVRLSVSDGGVGFDPAAVAQAADDTLGLLSIRERAEALGGAMEISAAPGRGTCVTLTLPRAESGG